MVGSEQNPDNPNPLITADNQQTQAENQMPTNQQQLSEATEEMNQPQLEDTTVIAEKYGIDDLFS